jgi:hypothetical protein
LRIFKRTVLRIPGHRTAAKVTKFLREKTTCLQKKGVL